MNGGTLAGRVHWMSYAAMAVKKKRRKRFQNGFDTAL
jgi:hypothetical protein